MQARILETLMSVFVCKICNATHEVPRLLRGITPRRLERAARAREDFDLLIEKLVLLCNDLAQMAYHLDFMVL